MRSGYILVEILVGTAIAAVVSSGLIVAFYQMNRVSISIDETIDMNSQVSIMNYQFERDISGVFVPILEEIVTDTLKKEEEKKEEGDAQGEKPDTDEGPHKPDVKEQQEGDGQEENNQELKKVFYGVNKGENLQLLTFISSNPLLVYWGSQAGKPIPHLVRVTYLVQPDEQNKNSYTLYRQESIDLEYRALAEPSASRQGRAAKEDENKVGGMQALLRGIKKITVAYEYVLPEKKEEKNAQPQNDAKQGQEGEQAKQKKKKPVQYARVPEWKEQPKKESSQKSDTKKEEKRPEIPSFVHVQVQMWDAKHKRETTSEFVYQILAGAYDEPNEEEEQEDQRGAHDEHKGQQGTSHSGSQGGVDAAGANITSTRRGAGHGGPSYGNSGTSSLPQGFSQVGSSRAPTSFGGHSNAGKKGVPMTFVNKNGGSWGPNGVNSYGNNALGAVGALQPARVVKHRVLPSRANTPGRGQMVTSNGPQALSNQAFGVSGGAAPSGTLPNNYDLRSKAGKRVVKPRRRKRVVPARIMPEPYDRNN